MNVQVDKHDLPTLMTYICKFFALLFREEGFAYVNYRKGKQMAISGKQQDFQKLTSLVTNTYVFHYPDQMKPLTLYVAAGLNGKDAKRLLLRCIHHF